MTKEQIEVELRKNPALASIMIEAKPLDHDDLIYLTRVLEGRNKRRG